MSDEIDKKFEYVKYLIEKVGVVGIICVVIMWFMWAKFEKFEDKVMWKLERIIRNTRSIMQELKIPVIFDGDRDEKK